MKPVNEIAKKRFAVNIGSKLKTVGTPTTNFSFDKDKKIMLMTIKIPFDMEGNIVNETDAAIKIEPKMGDLFVATMETDLKTDITQDVHFSYDNENTKVMMIMSVPEGDKGNHSS
ncbi:MAG: hypothetical protein WCF67_07265 [Chitinophagaceae bacterium]